MDKQAVRIECLRLAIAGKGILADQYVEVAQRFEAYIGEPDAGSIAETVPVLPDVPKRGRPKGSGKLREEAGPGVGSEGVHVED